MKDIQLLTHETIVLDYRTVKSLQGNRKILSSENEKKLLKSLVENGRFVPEFVWLDPSDGTHYALDGHQRLKVYEKHNITFSGSHNIPFLLVHATDRQDAARKLQIIDSDFGTMTQAGMQLFADDFSLDTDWLNSTTASLSFPTFNFIDQARAFQANIERDFIPPPSSPSVSPSAAPTPVPSIGEVSLPKTPIPVAQPTVQQPKSSDDDHANIVEVVTIGTKRAFNNLVLAVMQKQGFQIRGEAVSYIVQQFTSIYA